MLCLFLKVVLRPKMTEKIILFFFGFPWFAQALNSPWKSINPLKSPWKLKNLLKSLKSPWIFPSSPWILTKGLWINKASLMQCCFAHRKLWNLGKTQFCVWNIAVKLFQVHVASGIVHCCYLTYFRNQSILWPLLWDISCTRNFAVSSDTVMESKGRKE